VYRARDTKLDREVAIKVLPSALAQHPDRLARFEREAKVLAALNHPNIAAVYGVEAPRRVEINANMTLTALCRPLGKSFIRTGVVATSEVARTLAQSLQRSVIGHDR